MADGELPPVTTLNLTQQLAVLTDGDLIPVQAPNGPLGNATIAMLRVALAGPVFSPGLFTAIGQTIVPEQVLAIQTTGYSAAGKGGGLYMLSLDQASAASVHRAKSENGLYFDLVAVEAVTPEQFGAAGDGAADDTAALQAMADYLASLAATSVLEAHLARRYLTSATIYIRSAQRWTGAAGQNYVAGSAGTGIITSSAVADVLHVQCAGPVHIDGLGINTSVARTAGAYVVLDGNFLVGGNAPYSAGCSITRCFFENAYDHVRVVASINWTIRDNSFVNFHQNGIYLSGEGWNVASQAYTSNGDDSTGQSHITNNVIWDLSFNDSTACVRYACGGDIRISGNKLLGGEYAVWLMLDRAARTAPISTGTLIVSGNSIEQQRVGPIRVQQTAPNSGNFGNVIVADNQLSIIGVPTGAAEAQFILSVTAGTSSNGDPCWLKNVTVTGNVVNGMGAPSVTRAMFDIEDGEFVVCADNVLNGFAQINVTGVEFGVNVRGGYCGPNVINADQGKARYGSNSAYVLFADPAPMLVSQLPVAAADGSRLYCSDGLIGDQDVLAPGGSGCSVVRQGGVWVPQQTAGMVRQSRYSKGDLPGIEAGSIGTTQTFGTSTDDDLNYRVDGGDHVFGMGGQEAGRFVRSSNGAGAGISPAVAGGDPALNNVGQPCLYVRSTDGALRYWNVHAQAWQTIAAS